MNYIVSVYSREAFREFILPSVRDADYELVLGREVFGLSSDVTLRLEIIGESWRLNPDGGYRIFREEETRDGAKGPVRRVRREITRPLPVPFQGMVRLVSREGEDLSVFSGVSGSPLKAFEKYDIRSVDHITVGKDPGNMIRIGGQETVSGKHARLYRRGNEWYVECPGINGLYLDGKILKGSRALAFGSVLNIIGLRMVFLKDTLAVDSSRPGITVDERLLPKRAALPSAGSKRQGSGSAGNERGGSGSAGNERGGSDSAGSERWGSDSVDSARVIYHRSPRDTGRIENGTITVEAPPAPSGSGEKPFFITISPSLLMLIPMALGCVLVLYAAIARGEDGPGWVLYTGLAVVGASLLAGILWAAGLVRAGRRRAAEEERKQYEAYSAYLVRKTGEIRSVYEQNAAALKAAWPDAASCARRDASSPSLWNCSPRSDDFLRVRLGTGSMDFQVEIRVPETALSPENENPTENPALLKDHFRKLHDVPVHVDLTAHPVIGLVGGSGKRGALETARILSAQLAATHCYTDVKLGYIFDRNAQDDAGQWEFARWLPHVWSGDHRLRYVAHDRESVTEVSYELSRIFRGRMEGGTRGDDRAPNSWYRRTKEGDVGGRRDGARLPKPWYVLFISDISLIEDELLARFLLDPAPELGLTVLILADTVDHLPMACEFIIENDEKYCGMYSVSRRKEEMTDIAFDFLDPALLMHFSRTLSNISVAEREEGGEIPSRLTFYEMHGIRKAEELISEERWLKNRTSDSLRALIGVKAGGAPIFLDMHEKYHGPHALLGGTTGSGKSELLATFILSLAVNYSPEDVSFFIIDYKGGGMAGLFKGLPHLKGEISNLSGNQAHRAMISVKSENRRRQRIFNRYGVNHIDQYTRLRKMGGAGEALPHLFIVIDEFAELKKEEPEFMKELISVAQVGRSLGVHLVLATQKPEGTVDDNIRSNARARLCLRVESREDSLDMLTRPDAAFLTRTGRAYLQVGSDEVYELFQSGWSGAPSGVPAAGAGDGSARLLDITGRTVLSAAAPVVSPGGEEASGVPDETELQAVKGYLARLAAERGLEAGHPLWLPVLPEELYLQELEEAGPDGHGWASWTADGRDERGVERLAEADRDRKRTEGGLYESRAVRRPAAGGCPVGLVDDPENQRREILRLSFPEGGHHAVYGISGSGKSTFLETALLSLMKTYTPAELSVYILDYGGGTLGAFSGAPHVGGVVQEGGEEGCAKLFHMLMAVLEERKRAARRGPVSFPAMVVVIDNFASFRERTGDAWERALETIGREGSRFGICLLLSAGMSGNAGIPGRLADYMKTVFCLAMQERHLYYGLLRTRSISVLPEAGVKGRGLAVKDGRVLEFQTALSARAADDYRRLEAVSALCGTMKEAWEGPCARPIPMIPDKPEWESFAALPEAEEAFKDPSRLPVGYDEETAGVCSLKLSEVFCFLVTGAARTGRTNFLRVMAASCIRKGADTGIFDPEGEMEAFAGADGVQLLRTEEELLRYSMEVLAPAFKERNVKKHALEMAGAGEEELFEASLAEKPVFFLIADFEAFIRLTSSSARGLGGFMETLFRKGRFHNIYFAAVLPENSRQLSGAPAYELFVSYGTGIRFGGNPAKDTVLDFGRLSLSERTRIPARGVGLLASPGGEPNVKRIVVPLARFKKEA